MSKKRKAAKPHDGPKIVTIDIETAPNKSYHWGLFDQNIGLEQIAEEWTILSVSWKWLHEKEVHYLDAGGRGAAKVRDDRALLEAVWNILDEAEIVVGQNVQGFDLKKINARMLMSGFKPYSPVKVVDTMLIAKRHFAFTSNKLAWQSKHLTETQKSEHKQFPGFELWAEVLKDNKKAWAEMKKYNCIDVISTEQLYLKVRPWVEGHPNVAAYSAMEEIACPKCGSEDVQLRGEAMTQTGRYHRYQCKNCGGWARSRYTTNSKQKRMSLLSN